MKPRVTLITLGVDDLEKAVAFYRDGLGWQTPESSVLNSSTAPSRSSIWRPACNWHSGLATALRTMRALRKAAA